MYASLLLCGLVTILWARVALRYREALLRIPWLAPAPEGAAPDRERITAILPARNEEVDIGRSLESLLSKPRLVLRVKRAGFHIGFRLAPDCLEVRMFKGNRQAFWGTTKSFSTQARWSRWAPMASMAAAVLLLCTAPAVAAVGAATGSAALLAAGAATYLFQAATLLQVCRLMRLRPVRGSMEWRCRESLAPR